MSSITDKPIISKVEDSLKIEKYANSLSKFIKNSDTPITIGLQGEWGTGKTSLMSLLLEDFNKSGKVREIATSWVNTWEYSLFKGASETTPAVLSGMLQKLRDENEDIWTIRDQATDKVKMAAKFLSGLANQVITNQTGINIKDAASGGSGNQAGKVAEIAEIKNLIKSIISDLIDHSGNEIKKVVFFVDDLDRIPPSDAVEVLESLKNIFDIPKCVFILAIDYDVVVKGLESKFGPKTKENEREFRSFFDKIIQVPFTMPTGAYDINTFLKVKLADLKVSVDENDISIISKIIRFTIGSNPRSLKRYLNTFSLVNQIIEDDEDEEDNEIKDNIILLFAVLGIQVSYPKIFRLITQNTNYLDWDFKYGNKIGIDTIKLKDEIENIGESELTDEVWEQIIWGYCQKDPFLKVKCFNILELFNFLRETSCKRILGIDWDENLIKDNKYNLLKEKLFDQMSSVLEFASITNVDDDLEIKQAVNKSGSVTYFGGYNNWIQEMKTGQEENKALGIKKRKPVNIEGIVEELLKYWNDYFESQGYDLSFTPTGGCTVKYNGKKITNIGFSGSGNNKNSKKIEFLILRSHKRDYKRPIIEGLESDNCRKYDPNGKKSHLLPWGKEFFKLIAEPNVLFSKTDEIKLLINESAETIDEGKRLKVTLDNHHILEDIYNGTFNLN